MKIIVGYGSNAAKKALAVAKKLARLSTAKVMF